MIEFVTKHNNQQQQSKVKNNIQESKMHSNRNSHSTVQDRLGERGPERPLDREELESRRPQVKSWEVNPEMVPRNRYGYLNFFF